MTRTAIFIVCVCFFSIFSFSQAISGTVVSDTIAVSDARIVLKKGDKILSYAFSGKDGRFTFRPISDDSLEVEVAHLNYQTFSMLLAKPTSSPLKFNLVKKTNALPEVLIKNDLPIWQKKDTVAYDPKHFLDGSERVVEDLLKKLPGISVADNGKITYKGKEIQALMIDGDDIFNSKYTVGSQNLDVNAVETVEAIENFNKNKVLHKITETDKVAINLKLKKGLAVFTAHADLQSNFYSKYDNSLTALLIDTQFKGFSANSINDTGDTGDTDFSFIDANTSIKSKPRELILQGQFPRFFGERNSLLNNTISTSNSLKAKISKQTSTTTAINFYKDRIWQDYVNLTRYRFGDEDFTYRNADRQINRPQTISISNQTEYFNDDDLQINTGFTFERRQAAFANDLSNNGFAFENSLNTVSVFTGGMTEITKKLGAKSAVSFLAILSHSHSEQRFLVSPPIEIDESLAADRQHSRIGTNFMSGRAQYYRNWEKVDLKITNTTERKTDALNSRLYGESDPSEGFINDVGFYGFCNQFSTQVKFGRKKLKVGLMPTLWYNEADADDKKAAIFDCLLRADIKYALTKKHSFQLNFFQYFETPALENVFTQPVLTSYRDVSFNDGKIGNIKNTEVSLGYTISDFYNTFFFRASVSHTHRDKDYYYLVELTPAVTYNKTILLNQGNDRTRISLSVHKLIPFLKINVKCNTSFSKMSFYNYVEDSPLRSIRKVTGITRSFCIPGLNRKST